MDYQGTSLEFVKNLNEKDKSVNILLFGEIGSSDDPEKRKSMVNGDDFAKEIVFLSEVGFTPINININSIGGSIRQGMSIINAMNIARMNGSVIPTNIIGVADSMAGMISAFGNIGHRSAANFSSGVVHEPLIKNDKGQLITIEELPDGDNKTELLKMKDTLITLLSTSTGKSNSEVKEVMKKGKRLSAKEMKNFGMVDNVVKLSNESVETKNKTAVELMAACSNIKIENNKTMELVNLKLQLNKDAGENSAVDAIDKLQNKVSENTTALTEKDKEIAKLKTDNETLVNAAKEKEDAAAESYVDGLIDAGKLSKDKREVLVNQAQKDFDGFKAITESLETSFVDVTEHINKGGDGDGDGDADEKRAKQYHKLMIEGGDALKNLEKSNPTKFKKLEDAYEASNTNFDSL